MRKKLVSAIDGIRNNLQSIRNETESTEDLELDFELAMEEKVLPENCALSKIVRHGFPDEPRCMAFDCVQRLIAIGSARGSVRLLGQAGVDVFLKHDSNEPVMFVQFLVNEGGLITVLRDDTIHLWNYRQTTPKVVNSLKMAKERITCVYLPFQSKWLYIGTDKGNAYFISLATFELSAYVINWNKAIDVSCRVHPGAISQFSLCPNDSTRLLIVFSNGCVALWNIQTREAERYAVDLSPTKCVCWHSDGRQFMCGHKDGSITIWSLKKPKELVHRITPHSPNDSKLKCRPITHLYWSSNSDGDQMIVFAGGMPEDEGVLPALTIFRGKGSCTVLEMDYSIVELCPLNASSYATATQYPYGVAVLMKADFLVIDLLTQGYPCFECPYSMDIHESPVTFVSYYSDCPVDLIAALTLVGRNQRRQGTRQSDRPWPITGGIGRECATGHQEMLLTGHEDGSIKFWQASSENLQIMYKLKTGRHFERVLPPAPLTSSSAANSCDVNSVSETSSTTTTITAPTNASSSISGGPDLTFPSTTKTLSVPTAGGSTLAQISHAVVNVELCPDSRLLLVAGASGQVTLFRFVKTESCQDIAVVVLQQLCSGMPPPSTPTLSVSTGIGDESVSNNYHLKPQRGSSSTSQRELRRQADTVGTLSSRDSHSTDTSCGSQCAEQLPLKVRGGALRRPAGYQPELVCQIPWIGSHTPERITALALNSAFGVLAIGTASGVALVDIVTSTLIYSWSNAELHNRDAIPFGTCAYAAGLATATSTAQPFDLETMHQSMAAAPSPPMSAPNTGRSDYLGAGSTNSSSLSGNLAKTFVRLNTDFKQRSMDRQRPVLSKAQSMAVPSCTLSYQTSSTHHYNFPPTTGSPQLEQRNSLATNHGGFDSNDDANVGSRSSSVSSLEPIENNCFANNYHSSQTQLNSSHQQEFVTSLAFINSYSKKRTLKSEPSLWLGMSTGVCVAFNLILPTDRIISNVVVAPSGSVIRLKDRLLYSTFLNRDFCLTVGATEIYRDPNKDSAPSSANLEKTFINKVLTKASLSPTILSPQETSSNNNSGCSPEEFSQLGVFVSEYEVRVISLPGYTQFFHYRPEIPFVKAKSSHIRGYPVLLCLNGASQIVVLSLPSLRLLLQTSLFRGSVDVDDDICHKTDMSEHGLGIYAASPSELQKFTINSELAAQVAECSGELFVPCDTPEPPKTSFLRGVSTLFGATGQKDNVDLDSIFSEKPTNPSSSVKSVARQIPSGNLGLSRNPQLTNMESANSRTLTAGQAANMAIQNLNERGERLNAVVDATENLRNNAMNFQSRSSKLVEKYEKKKWYQL